MRYDNERDRKTYGYDAGSIVDGVVTVDPSTGEHVLVDDDGLAFSSQEVLKTLVGKKVRMTMIGFDSIEELQNLLAKHES